MCAPTGRYCPGWASRCDPCCESRQSSFAPYGSGLTALFKVEKWFVVIFLILSILSLPMLWLNVYGNGQDVSWTTVGFEATTLGSLAASSSNNPNGTAVVRAPFTGTPVLPGEWAGMTYALADVLGAVVLLIGWAVLKWGESAENTLVGEYLTPDLYTVFLDWVPPNADEVSLREHFEALCARLVEESRVQLSEGWEEEVEVERRRAKRMAARHAEAAAKSGTEPPAPPPNLVAGSRHVADCIVVEDNLALLSVYMRRGEVLRRFEALTLAIHRAETALQEADAARAVLLRGSPAGTGTAATSVEAVESGCWPTSGSSSGGVGVVHSGPGSSHWRVNRGCGAPCGLSLFANARGRLAVLNEQREDLARRVHDVTGA